MKKRMVSLFLACVMCLCLVPVAALAADLYETYPYEVTPFRAEDFTNNPNNTTYVGSTEPEIEIREMTIDGTTREVSVFPAGTKFKGLGEASVGNTVSYINGEPDYTTYFDPSAGLPAQGVYKMEVYSIYYGYLADAWVTAEGSGTSVDPTEPSEPTEPTEPTEPSEPTEISFTDVAASAYYAEPVTWAVAQNITSGTSATTFSPDETCTRAQIITFLWRAAGSPAPENPSAFTDVKADAYYAQAAAWAVENDMASGDTFSPDAPCTRLMAVEFMWKQAGSPSAAAASFTDVSSSAVNWAVETDVTSGTSATTFSPNETCTRAQIVTFLYRAFAE